MQEQSNVQEKAENWNAEQSVVFDQRRSTPHLFGGWLTDVEYHLKAIYDNVPEQRLEQSEEEVQAALGLGHDLDVMLVARQSGMRASALRWARALFVHGRKAWGADYAPAKALLALDRMQQHGLLLRYEEYAASTYGNAGMPLHERYRHEIEAFVQGRDRLVKRNSRLEGHVWIARHSAWETLVVEPPTGGQYELALRFPGAPEGSASQYVGYSAGAGFLLGHGIDH
jgi:hypothetical protein